MENTIELTSVFIANGMAILLAVQLLHKNHWRYAGYGRNNTESGYLRTLIYMSAAACVIDPIICYADGRPGQQIWVLVYVLNSILFLMDILVGVGWIVLVCTHLMGRVPKYQKILIAVLSAVGILAILVNPVTPLLYSVDANNVYHREILFWLITFIEGVFLLDGILVYLYSKMQGGIFKFFPVWQFVVPIAIGIVVQGSMYGVSIVYPAAMVSFAGLINSLKDETLFMDPLTGLYSRSFLEVMNEEIARKGTAYSVTGMMLDLNEFKSINDSYGHKEGDIALMATASILKTAVGALGCVVRYAGDEFVILLNTRQSEAVDGCIRAIHTSFQEKNQTSEKEYDLTVSIGYCFLSEETPTLEAVLTRADERMYDDKRKYHGLEQRRKQGVETSV